MLRKIRQWFAGAEITALGNDLEKVLDQVATAAHRVEGLQLRLERLSNRVNMRLTRAGAPGAREQDDRDQEILREIRQRSGNGGEFPEDDAPPRDW